LAQAFGSSLNHVVEGTTPRHKMGHVSIILLFLPVVLICGSNSTENHTASTASPPNSTTPAEVDSNSSMTTTTTTPTMTTVNQKLVAMVTIPENYTAESLKENAEFQLWIKKGIAKAIKNVTEDEISSDDIVITGLRFVPSATRRLATERTMEIDYSVTVADASQATAVTDFASSADVGTTLMESINSELGSTALGDGFSVKAVTGVSTVVSSGNSIDAAHGLVCIPLVSVVATAAALCA